MTAVVRTATQSMLLPRVWAQTLEMRKLRLVSPLLVIDCFEADGIHIFLRPEMSQLDPAEIEITLNGNRQTPVVRAVPRGVHLRLEGNARQSLALSWSGAQITPEIAAPLDQMAGKNVLFAFVNGQSVDVLNDWLAYHARTHGANGAVLINRVPEEAGVRAQLKDRTIEGMETVIWADCPVPLGDPQEGPEQSRHYAPDAPGKAMLEPVGVDPWRSSLVEIAMLEAARHRFMRRARAVLFATPADLVAPAAHSVFDAAAGSESYLQFGGTPVYPFTLSDQQAPRFAEHGCVAFDGARAPNIWCSAPRVGQSDVFWRQHRAGGEADPAGAEFAFFRAMAVRHPGLKPSELAPKTSLVGDDTVAALMDAEFGAVPKLPPALPKIDPSGWKNERILAVTTMKNEGPFILEWLAYHRAIGVTDFLAYTNDCTDGTDAMFDLLAHKGHVTHRQNPYRTTGERPQHAALHDAAETQVAHEADWIICMDVDEFINIHVGAGRLADLFAAAPEANMFALTWRLFGNGDVARFEDAPILRQFTHAAAPITRKPHQAWGFKTLFRNVGFYKKFGVHRPKGLRPEYLDDINWVNGAGQQMPQNILRSGWRSNTSTIGYDLVTLNHYALRSAESFLVKRDRGRVNHVERDQGLAYWFRMNHNATTDASIQTRLPAFEAELAALKADPQIAAQHDACVAAHKARIAELMGCDDYRALYEEITGTRLRALSRHLHHFGTKVFLEGPSAVPEDFEPTRSS